MIEKALNSIMNAKRAGKHECLVPSSSFLKKVLDVMARHKYIEWKVEKNKFEKIKIKILNINKCKAISPRFHVTIGKRKKTKNIEKYIRRYLPARDFGILIISTSKGLLTHNEAIEKKIGGALVAYCY